MVILGTRKSFPLSLGICSIIIEFIKNIKRSLVTLISLEKTATKMSYSFRMVKMDIFALDN